MRESRTYGSVRGALSNERPYREHLQQGPQAPAARPQGRGRRPTSCRVTPVIRYYRPHSRTSRLSCRGLCATAAVLGRLTRAAPTERHPRPRPGGRGSIHGRRGRFSPGDRTPKGRRPGYGAMPRAAMLCAPRAFRPGRPGRSHLLLSGSARLTIADIEADLRYRHRTCKLATLLSCSRTSLVGINNTMVGCRGPELGPTLNSTIFLSYARVDNEPETDRKDRAGLGQPFPGPTPKSDQTARSPRCLVLARRSGDPQCGSVLLRSSSRGSPTAGSSCRSYHPTISRDRGARTRLERFASRNSRENDIDQRVFPGH